MDDFATLLAWVSGYSWYSEGKKWDKVSALLHFPEKEKKDRLKKVVTKKTEQFYYTRS